MVEVRMPKMGDGMIEGTILRWLKQEGDTINVNEALAEIETDKANVEMPAEDAGTLAKIIVQEGQTVPVGTVVAYIGAEGETLASNNGGGTAQTTSVSSSQAAPPPPEEEGRAPETGPASERLKASPLARRMAEEMGLDLAQITGSGIGGTIHKRDIEAFAAQRGTAPRHVRVPTAQAPSAPTDAPPVPTTAAPTPAGEDVEVSRMRKAISRVTIRSVQTAPHFYVTMPIEMDRVMNLLDDMNAQNPEQKITVNDVIVKACAVALTKFPDVNVSWTPDEKIRRYTQINIGIAVVSEQGLVIPVITDCDRKTLREISVEAKALIGKARGGTITPQEMSGGTFSVSNLGMFGVEEFTAIINPPQSAILAVGTVAKEVVVAEDGGFEARQRMRVTLSCDHRTVDGVLGAKFLQAIKRLLESPLNLLA